MLHEQSVAICTAELLVLRDKSRDCSLPRRKPRSSEARTEHFLPSGFQPERAVSQLAEQVGERRDVLVTPLTEHAGEDSISRLVDSIGHFATLSRDHGLPHPFVVLRCFAFDEPTAFQLCHLPAHCCVVPADAIREMNDTDRAEAVNENKQGEERPIKRDSGFLDHPRIALGAVHDAYKIDDGPVDSSNIGQAAGIMRYSS